MQYSLLTVNSENNNLFEYVTLLVNTISGQLNISIRHKNGVELLPNAIKDYHIPTCYRQCSTPYVGVKTHVTQ